MVHAAHRSGGAMVTSGGWCVPRFAGCDNLACIAHVQPQRCTCAVTAPPRRVATPSLPLPLPCACEQRAWEQWVGGVGSAQRVARPGDASIASHPHRIASSQTRVHCARPFSPPRVTPH